MPALIKVLLIALLIAIACLAAGVYGIAHDQLSYTLSPDYFHHLKFEQFRVGEHFHNRVGVAFVGWSATWWMGLLVGTPLVLVGLVVPGRRSYAFAVCKSFALAIGTAAVIGLIGLAIAKSSPLSDLNANFPFPQGVTDKEAFLEVGLMHNASYLGGAVGLFVAIGYLLVTGIRQRRR